MNGARPTYRPHTLRIVLICELALCCLALCGCGSDRPEHAGVAAIPLDSDAGAAVGASARAYPGSGSLPRGDIEDYKGKLVGLLSKTESQLRSGTNDKARLAVLQLRKQQLEDKLDSVEFASAENRQFINSAHASVRGFLARFAPDLEWEAQYALQSGDLSLASALVQDVVDKLRSQSQRGSRARSSGEVLELDDPLTQDAPIAEKMAAEAIFRIARLAEDDTDFEAAERGYELARSYNPEIGVAADAAGAQASLLRALGREEEAGEIQAEINEMLAR